MKHEPMTTKQRLAMKQVVLQVAEERYRQDRKSTRLNSSHT